MPRWLRGISASALASVMLLVAASPLFAQTGERITVQYNPFTVELDGKDFALNHFVYQGVTYLPVRSLAELIGMPVHFYNPSKRAYIGRLPANELPAEQIALWNSVTEPPARTPVTLEASGSRSLRVHFNPIEIKVDGHTVGTDNLLLANTTYVPLREISELLGMDIAFSRDEGLIRLGETGISDDWLNVLTLSREHHVFYLSHDPEENLYVFYDHVNQEDLAYVEVPESFRSGERVSHGIRMRADGDTLYFHKDDLTDKGILRTQR